MPVSCVSIYGKNSEGSMPRLHHYMLLMSSRMTIQRNDTAWITMFYVFHVCRPPCVSQLAYTPKGMSVQHLTLYWEAAILLKEVARRSAKKVWVVTVVCQIISYICLFLWRIILGGAKSELIETGLHFTMPIHPCMWSSSLQVYNSVDAESMQCAQLHWIGRIAS